MGTILNARTMQLCCVCRNNTKFFQVYKKYRSSSFKNYWDAIPEVMSVNSSLMLRCYSNNGSEIINANENIINKYFNSLMIECKTVLHLTNKLKSFNANNVQEVLNLLTSRAALCDSIKSLEELKSDNAKDKELESLVQSEKEDYKQQLKLLNEELVFLLIPEEPYDKLNDLVIEVKYGVGGQEAMLFANDLFQMYCNYVSYKGWKFEIAEVALSDIGR